MRIILASISYHPDIQALGFASYVVDQGKILDLYDFLPNLPSTDPVLKSYPTYFFNYPPVIYFFHSVFSLLSLNLVGGSFVQDFLFNFPQTLGDPRLNLLLLFFKLPYLIFDFAAAFLIMRFFGSQKNKLIAFSLWLFNPVNLYATYLMGQFDIIPTFFVVFALYLVHQQQRFRFINHTTLAAIALGIGASFKIYPLFLIIPLASLVSGWKEKTKIILLGPLVYLLTILPFLPSPGFRSTALVAGQTLKSLYAQVPVSGGESILLFPAALIFFYLLFIYLKVEGKFLWQRFYIILLLFFIFTHYHPQWFLWLTPFFILDIIKSGFRHTLVVGTAFVSFFGLLFFFEPSLTLGLFSPVSAPLYNTAGLWQLLQLNPDINFLRSVLQTIFAGAAFYLIYYYFPRNTGAKV